jgi:hypothetical protein
LRVVVLFARAVVMVCVRFARVALAVVELFARIATLFACVVLVVVLFACGVICTCRPRVVSHSVARRHVSSTCVAHVVFLRVARRSRISRAAHAR